MELGPICRALSHNKTRVVLVVVQIALTLAVVVNCVVMICDERAKMLRPTGIDEENLLVVTSKPFDPAFRDTAYVRSAVAEDLRVLRGLAGVRAATASGQVPLSGGGSATGRRPVDEPERDRVTAPYFTVADQVIEALGLDLVAGTGFTDQDFVIDDAEPEPDGPPQITNVVVSQALADELFPNGKALGSVITGRDGRDQERIVGIVARMQCSWPQSDVAENSMLMPAQPGSPRRVFYLVRAEPGERDRIRPEVEAALLQANAGRIVEVETMTEVKRETYRDEASINQLLGAMIVLLVFVTSLGVIGLTAYSVTQRTRQIGTRRALGATRAGIVLHFLVENWVVTTAGLAVGTGMTFALNYGLGQAAEVPRVGISTLLAGIVLLWLLGLGSALVPALRGAAVSPVIATRTV
jgi:putative ABC transport system permease protein